MNRLLENQFVPPRALPCFLRIYDSGYQPPEPKQPQPTGPASNAANISLITSTGGLIGINWILLTPFYDSRIKTFYFAIYDSNNFDCEEDAFYDFKMEDVHPGRNVDVHKVYLQYRNIGIATFTINVTVVQYDKVKDKTKFITIPKVIKIGTAKPDSKIYDKYIDLKIVGLRPQLRISRKANSGPLSIVTAMLVGNMAEEQLV